MSSSSGPALQYQVVNTSGNGREGKAQLVFSRFEVLLAGELRLGAAVLGDDLNRQVLCFGQRKAYIELTSCWIGGELDTTSADP